jgi:hypothetical protein
MLLIECQCHYTFVYINKLLVTLRSLLLAVAQFCVILCTKFNFNSYSELNDIEAA